MHFKTVHDDVPDSYLKCPLCAASSYFLLDAVVLHETVRSISGRVPFAHGDPCRGFTGGKRDPPAVLRLYSREERHPQV